MEQTIILGIGFGLVAAFFQSLSYLCTRLFIKQHNGKVIALLALSHILMGLISIPVVVLLWPETMLSLSEYGPSLLGTTGFYLLAQFFLFTAIIHSEPSRVSPLLGLKVFILTLISVIFLGMHFNMAKWIAVMCTTVAVLLLSSSGKRLEGRFIVLGLLACVCYCISDLYIKSLVDHFAFMGIMRGATMAVGLSYIACGAAGAVVVAIYPKHSTWGTWLYAVPFAASWFVGVIFLFSCFGLVGVVYGNILQSTRGIISIALGFIIAHLGFESLEAKQSKRIIAQRLIAAVLMTAAVVLFLI